MSEQVARTPAGRFAPGASGCLTGRRGARLKAERDEAERVREESALVADLGHVPSYTERAIIEQLSALIVRGRRLRQAGQGADAEMIARLVMRGLTKLGVRQGSKQTESMDEYLARTAREAGGAR
jgi:hypothetical protein